LFLLFGVRLVVTPMIVIFDSVSVAVTLGK